MAKILYSAYVLTDKGKEAISQFTSDLPNKFGHHCTIQFMPKEPLALNGIATSIFAYGRFKNELVDCLLIQRKSLLVGSLNDYAHITLSTAEGIKPFESNKQLALNADKIEFFETPIEIETIITDIYS